VPNETLIEVIKQNMRLPSRAMGDLRAQVTAVKTGERRFLELVTATAAKRCWARSRPSWIIPK